MNYTVKEVSAVSGVTVKTLHHYHKLGLLVPAEVSDAGYRLYGDEELKRLQHILFYKELDFPLAQIKTLMDGGQERLTQLTEQEQLLRTRRERLDEVMKTLQATINHEKAGEAMAKEEMFRGFGLDSEEAWREALGEQHVHLNETYGVDLLEDQPINPAAMNELAEEAAQFMGAMAEALRGGIMHKDERVRKLLVDHAAFLTARMHPTGAAELAAQTKFFLTDAFHLQMLESQQVGLAYYLAAAADAWASESASNA
ncbi:MerR family transcriptional regulator [Paenibacillus methanolicus]|uniref:DNA-binding transcriptional MerR regulator n=1 Tax=Paenibacillus methanolicus TaxID=582686 RepID=A0A5S5C5Z6_9BACL|nr:MerR family transcriptional regulator [Paenibacillus methanolicus]TYP74018.1 DNA-binding transcriptional MerR regulator [Paenibacillus methanolicus]